MAQAQADMAVIPPGWVGKEEAEEIAGKTIKSIQRLMREGAIEVSRREIAVPGRSKPVTIYRRADLDRLRPGVRPAGAVSAVARRGPGGLETLAGQLAAAIAVRTQPANGGPMSPGLAVPLESKPLLTIQEASAYTGISRAQLRGMRTEEMGRRFGRRFLFRRAALAGL